MTLKNGWHTGRSNFTNLKAIGSYSGNVAYCIEPGISLKVGQTMNKYDENYFNNLAANGVISGDEIRLFVGRILQYGYRGTISTSWRSQNEAAANSIAQAYATQLLIWETVIGERDANFNHVALIIIKISKCTPANRRADAALVFQTRNRRYIFQI